MLEYEKMKKEFIQGWNTWNTFSVLSHVYMPYGFAINLCIKDPRDSKFLSEAYIGQQGEKVEQIFPGAHAYDASYTELKLEWFDNYIQVESAKIGDDTVLLITDLKENKFPSTLIAESAILWNKKGYIVKEDDKIIGKFDDKEITVYSTAEEIFDPYAQCKTPYFAVKLTGEVGFSTGKARSIEEIKEIINDCKEKHNQNKNKYGKLSEAYNAMQTCLAWDTVYDPKFDRVISTVSRRWNKGWSGYVMFCWDNYFAAYMAALDNKEIAYSNAIEITKEKTEKGFVPNFTSSLGAKSRDRSQPPVGSLTVKALYEKYKEKWLVEMLFDDLFTWNTWWVEHRQLKNGLFAWGSDPYEPVVGHHSEYTGNNNHQGAAFESGLDNSPMFDETEFDEVNHIFKQTDVGLTGLFIMDCQSLIHLAKVLGREKEINILEKRCKKAENALNLLWCEEDGIFYNSHSETGEFNKRISPTNFYSLYSRILTTDQKERLINEHFYNKDEFYGDYIMPSIARNDPAYKDQSYWRGRIWAPMNFLVYLGLKSHNIDNAAKDMADLSVKLILKEWLEKGHVHENYDADTGIGCDKRNSDAFYHWGGLLSLIALIEDGYMD